MYRPPHRKVPDLIERDVHFLARKWIAGATHVSFALARLFPKKIPIVFVSGFPKSGTVWVTQIVADYLQYPFVDLSFFPTGCPAVMHGHYLVHKNSPPTVYVVRDGRDAMISMYFYMASSIPGGDNPKLPWGYKKYFTGLQNKDQIRQFLPTFLRRQFERPFGCRWNWNTHVRSHQLANRPNIPLVRYEELLADPFNSAAHAIRCLTQDDTIDETALRQTIDKFSFVKQTGRKQGEEKKDSFVRKGISGDWKNYFSREAATLFHELAGQTLIDFGYESDASWIESCPAHE